MAAPSPAKKPRTTNRAFHNDLVAALFKEVECRNNRKHEIVYKMEQSMDQYTSSSVTLQELVLFSVGDLNLYSLVKSNLQSVQDVIHSYCGDESDPDEEFAENDCSAVTFMDTYDMKNPKDCRVMIFGIKPWTAIVQIPEDCPEELSKTHLKAFLSHSDVNDPLPLLPAGCFILKKRHSKNFLFFKYANQTQCSDIKSAAHKRLPASTKQHKDILGRYHKHIKAGDSFMEGKYPPLDSMASLESGKLSYQYSIGNILESDFVDISETTRTEALYLALYNYVGAENIHVTVTREHQSTGKDYSEYSGGGDLTLLARNKACAVTINNEEMEDEDAGPREEWSWLMCSRIQQRLWYLIIKQIKANTILCMTTSWHSALAQCSANDINKYFCTTDIVGYGVGIALGKGTVLLKVSMNFKTGRTTFTELAYNEFSCRTPAIIDSTFSYILMELTKE